MSYFWYIGTHSVMTELPFQSTLWRIQTLNLDRAIVFLRRGLYCCVKVDSLWLVQMTRTVSQSAGWPERLRHWTSQLRCQCSCCLVKTRWFTCSPWHNDNNSVAKASRKWCNRLTEASQPPTVFIHEELSLRTWRWSLSVCEHSSTPAVNVPLLRF